MKDRANEIYKRVEDQKSSRGRNQDALLAACLYIACRQEDKPRTVKGTAYDSFNIWMLPFIFLYINELPWTYGFQLEICSVANGATKKEIGRAKEYIVKQLGLENGNAVEMGTIHAGDFMVRFLYWLQAYLVILVRIFVKPIRLKFDYISLMSLTIFWSQTSEAILF